MTEPQATKELQLLTSIVIAEQNNYWLRFTAFSALTAALVVALVSVEDAWLVTLVGLVLSVCWSFVQWASYKYVVFYDEIWEPQIEALGFRSSDKKFWGGLARTTFVGAMTATLSVLFWLVLLFNRELFG